MAGPETRLLLNPSTISHLYSLKGHCNFPNVYNILVRVGEGHLVLNKKEKAYGSHENGVYALGAVYP